MYAPPLHQVETIWIMHIWDAQGRHMRHTVRSMAIKDPKECFIPAPVLPKRQCTILIFLAHPQVLPSSRQQG